MKKTEAAALADANSVSI